ncbi:hypothetical protein DL98DRAFT_631462, partial [Cadophora sp. DSE1049]
MHLWPCMPLFDGAKADDCSRKARSSLMCLISRHTSSRDEVSLKISLSLTMESPYVLSTSTNFDDVELAEISLKSFENNPLVYLTYPRGVSREVIHFHHKSYIQFTKEEGVELIRVVANNLPGKPTVAFGILFYGPKPPKKKLTRPADADFRFLDKLKAQTKLH